ncbi:uncharacterized protein LOC112690174 [Sipha flava]|uniref:Uncharacterized protein LOC112690174 n=1 Tax=Sipha flava TaxID=143950 RepID=A0A8B8GAV9_9HEMI|nr:uncharacterized protein LOC112690174 [Sipha flava]
MARFKNQANETNYNRLVAHCEKPTTFGQQIHSSTGENISSTILSELDKIGINIKDCRGQSYDNGTNMKGDMAKCNSKAMTFFGTMNRIYSLFAASPIRWFILKKHVPNCSVKRLSETRWESRVDSVKPIRYHAALIRDALIEVAESTTKPTIKNEAESLAINELENLEFIVSVIIWYDLLLSVNSVSKILQLRDMNLDVAINGLKDLLQFLKNYRDIGFNSAIKQ